MTRRREEAEGKNTVRLHRIDRSYDLRLGYACGLHVAKVAQESESAEFALGEQTLPVRALVATCRECNFPGIGRGELVGDEPLPELGLRGVARLRVGEEEDVAEPNDSGAVILRERVLVEVGERGGESLLH